MATEEQVPPGPREQGVVRVRRKNGSTKTEPADAAPPAAVEEKPPELHTPFDEIPPDDVDPRRRDKPTLGVVELTAAGRAAIGEPLDIPGAKFEIPDVADKTSFRTLEDIMGSFPIGDSTRQYFVHVMRTHPDSFMGMKVKGVLRKIFDRMTLEEFRNEYGGGVYELIVYGPPRRGGITDDLTGLPRPQALTKPIRLTIPWHQNGGFPPNPEAAFDREEDEEDGMSMREERLHGDGRSGRLPFGIPPRQASPAAAQIVGHQLKHEETMDDRDRREREERRREKRHEENSAMSLLSRQHAEQMQMMQQQLTTLQQELKEARGKRSSDLDGVAGLITSLNPRASSDEMQSLRDSHQRELDRLTSAHRQELDTITRRHSEDRDREAMQHKAELDRIESRVQEATRRADDRVREVEAQRDRERTEAKAELARQKQELEAARDRDVTFERAERTRALEAQKTNYENILASERRNSEREIDTKKQISESQRDTDKRAADIEIRGLKSELARRDREMEELKRIADKNKNFDVGKALDDIRKNAELVGYAPKEEGGGSDEPEDFKSAMIRVLPKIPELLPQILAGAGQMFAQARGTTAQGQQGGGQPQQQRRLPPPQLPGFAAPPAPRRVFATEGAEPPAGATPQFFEPQQFQPQAIQVQQPAYQPPPPDPNQQLMQAQPPQVVTPIPGQQLAPAAPQPQPQPTQQAAPPQSPQMMQGTPFPGAQAQPQPPRPSAPPPPAAVPSAPPPPDPAMDAMILQGREQLLEPAFASKRPPAEVAAFIVGRVGKEQVKAFLPTFSPDAVVNTIRRHGVKSELVSRAGRRYLVELEKAIQAELAKP